jgi:gluconolactonase
MVRFDPDGSTVTIADSVDGKKLNTPNDLAIDRKGRIWFTNPWNEGNIDATERQELDNRSVLRADPQADGSYKVTRITFDTTQPNGILVSQDQSTLYVAESGYAKEIVRELRAYPILEDGTLGAYTTLFTWGADARGVHRGIDGMCLDRDGNIIATAGWEVSGPGPMIYVFSPSGRVLETHPVPAIRPTNCCFGGPDLRTLYVTTTEAHLFRVQTKRVGWAMYP